MTHRDIGPSAPSPASGGASRLPASQWDRNRIFDLVQDLRAELGLTSLQVMVYKALLSWLPTGRLVPESLVPVFAGNATIADRAGGPSTKSVQRTITRLEEIGLACRRMSSSGRRFRNQGDGCQDVYGVDLSPGFRMLEELQAQKARLDRQRAECTRLRGRCQALRVDLLAQLPQDDPRTTWLEDVAQLLRRKLSLDAVKSLLRNLKDLTADLQKIGRGPTTPAAAEHDPFISKRPSCPADMDRSAVRPGQDVRAIESKDKPEDESQHAPLDDHTARAIWSSLPQARRFYGDSLSGFSDFRENVFRISSELFRIDPHELHAAVRSDEKPGDHSKLPHTAPLLEPLSGHIRVWSNSNSVSRH